MFGYLTFLRFQACDVGVTMAGSALASLVGSQDAHKKYGTYQLDDRGLDPAEERNSLNVILYIRTDVSFSGVNYGDINHPLSDGIN